MNYEDALLQSISYVIAGLFFSYWIFNIDYFFSGMFFVSWWLFYPEIGLYWTIQYNMKPKKEKE